MQPFKTASLALLALSWTMAQGAAPDVPFEVRSARSGQWSDPATWMDKRMPRAGENVQIRAGHSVTYDVSTESTFVARNLRAWQTHYVLRPNLQFFLMDGLDVKDGVYGVYHPDYDAHVYRRIHFNHVVSEPINRGHDDESVQFGTFTYDDLRLENWSRSMTSRRQR